MVANRPQTLLPMSTANIPNKSLRKTANLRISEDCISHCILYSLKWNSAMLAWCQLLLSSSTDYHIFKHGFQISKHVRACRHVKLGPALTSSLYNKVSSRLNQQGLRCLVYFYNQSWSLAFNVLASSLGSISYEHSPMAYPQGEHVPQISGRGCKSPHFFDTQWCNSRFYKPKSRLTGLRV